MKLNSFARFFGIRGTKKKATARRGRTARPRVEALEDRTLMSVIPSATVTNQRIVDSAAMYPSVSVDPMNPLKLIQFNEHTITPATGSPFATLDGSYSTDGGKTWLAMPTIVAQLDPSVNPIVPFLQITDVNVAWDRVGNAYVLMSQHNSSTTRPVGKLMFEAYNFSGAAPVQTVTDQEIYGWFQQDPAFNPTIAIDNNTPVFVDPDSGTILPDVPAVTQTDTLANSLSRPDLGPAGIEVPKALYLAWNTNWNTPQGLINIGYNAQISGIMVAASDNGGISFSTPEYLTGIPGIDGSPQASAPQFLFTQGTNALSYHNNNITTPGGQMSIFYDQSPTFNLGNDVRFNQLMQSTSFPDGGVANQPVVVSSTYTSPGGPVADAILSSSGASIPVTTPFPINIKVTDPYFTTLNDISLKIDLIHPNMSQVEIVLQPPSGSGLSPIIIANQDLTGANLGVVNGVDFGTVFDDTIAVRDIHDPTAASPFVGTWFTDGAVPLSSYDGATAAQLTGKWTLLITDFVNSGNPPPFQRLDDWSINFSSQASTTGIGTISAIPLPTTTGFLPFNGAVGTRFPTTAVEAGPAGLPPGFVVAADNTLGIHSPYSGRIYLAYVDHGTQFTGQPLNTDISLIHSDDGGQTWSLPVTVNDDGSANDGFSTGLRGQWMPSLTVDQATGAVLVSYYDTRWDPTQIRSANMLSISIDGGATFSQSVFMNVPSTATNMITGATDVLTPIPGNAALAGTQVFGDHQSLTAWDGHVYAFFTSNLNEANTTEVFTADITYAAGPRIIKGDQGPVTLNSSFEGEPAPQFAADGRRELTGFSVTFDRPVFIPSFTPGQVTVLYRGPNTSLTQPGTPVAVGAIVPVDADWSGQMATTFFIQLLAPQSAPGTYSYTVGPQISDRVWSGRFDDNNKENLAVNNSFELPLNDPGTAQFYSSIPGWFLASGPNFDVQNNTYGPAAEGDQWLELGDSGGQRAIYQDIPTVAGQNYQVSFYFAAAPGTPQSANQMAVMWNGAQVATISADGSTATTPDWTQYIFNFKATGPTTRLQFVGQGGTSFGNTELDDVTVAPLSTNPMDQNANGVDGESNYDQFSMPQPINGVPFQLPYNTATEPLIIPGPYLRSQTTNPASSGSYVSGQATTTLDNVVLNTAASSINVRFDRQMNPAKFMPSAILSMTGPAGPITGPFTVTPVYAKLGDTTTDTFQIGFPTQILSGQYTLTLAPTMQDTAGNLVDTNQNAGLYTLEGFDPTSFAYTTSTYQLNNLSVTLKPGQTVTSQISVSDAFKIVQSASNPIMAQLSITDPNDPDLLAQLIAPDGTVIQLFSNVGGLGSPSHANFSNTIFSDFATTPIQVGVPPFDTGPYNPQKPLSALLGKGSAGKWTLAITNQGTQSGTLTSWSVSLPRLVPGTGLGEPVADQFTVGFRIFVQDPTNGLTTKQWVQVGPASENPTTGTNNGNNSGRVSSLAVDPSDPSGNTVYAAGASGGVWKTTNFLTNSPNGPTWQLLTAFGPTTSLNIGSIAVFGRNHDPNQSIIFAATGEGSTDTGGVGLLRSMDGGKSWQVLDSTVNFDSSGNVLPMSSTARDHKFTGDTAYKVVVDPTPLPSGQVVIYAAFSSGGFGGNSGGLWRSVDTGQTWQQIQAGNADDVVLEPASKDANGNLQLLYAHFQTPSATQTGAAAAGLYYTTSASTTTILYSVTGKQGVLLRRDDDPPIFDTQAVPVANDTISPTTWTSRVALAVPAVTGNPLQDTLYEGWIYAAVANSDGSFNGLFMSKDFGANWTKVRLGLNTLTKSPSNDNLDAGVTTELNLTGNQGTYDLSIAVDPNNPHTVFVGGMAQNGMIRVDTTGVLDPYALTGFNNYLNDGGQTMISTYPNGGVAIKTLPNSNPPAPWLPFGINVYSSLYNQFGVFGPSEPYLDLLRDPANPFLVPSSEHFTHVQQFNNTGTGATWTYYTDILNGSADQHALLAIKDPTTGLTRLIIGDDQGVFSGVDNGSGQLFQGGSNNIEPSTARNGNLAILQQYGGAVQPSVLAADIAGSMFYGMAQDDGFPASGSNILTTGNLNWNGVPGDGAAAATDQTGSGTVYQFRYPCCINTPPLVASDFFDVQFPNQNLFSRTSGLILPGDNPFTGAGEWGFAPTIMAPGGDAGVALGNFAVNPIDPSGIVIGGSTGNIFRTYGPSTGYGVQWFQIGSPTDTDGTYAYALAFGAPDPNAGPNNLDDFIYAGTTGGNVFVTFTGGGNAGSHAWKQISTGLDGSPVMQVVTDPKRGSHDAYAVTQEGVYYLPDSTATSPAWIKLNDTAGKGSIFNLTQGVWNNPKDQWPTLTGKNGQVFTSIAVDWRFAIPNTTGSGPSTVPVLYVGGFGGIYRSYDFGKTWNYYPNVKIDGAAQDGGYLPNTDVTRLSLALGNLNPTTGQPDMSSGLNMLVASTYGNSTYAIRLDNSPFAQYLAIPNQAPFVRSIGLVTTNIGQTLTGLQVNFSGPIDPVTVGVNDINSLTGPNGAIIRVKDIVDITPNNPDGSNYHNIWRIDFVTPTTVTGTYTLNLGPVISNYSGIQMASAYSGSVSFVGNRPPVLAQLVDQLIVPGTNSAPFTFAVGDPDTGAGSVTVTATSTNEALIGDGQTVNGITYPNQINITGTGATRTIVITPTANLHGSTRITLTATDPQGWSVQQSFMVYVDNTPVLSAIPDPTAIHDGKSLTIPLPAATDADGDTISFRDPATGTPLAFVSGYNPAYDLQQQLGLYEYFGPSGRSYFQSAAWGNGKWVFSAVNGGRYLIMPTGQILQYVPGAKIVADLNPVASLDPSVWVDPTLLTNAQAPTAPSNVTVTINNNANTLQVLPPATYVGTFRVTLAATDGILPTPGGSLTAAFLQANALVPHESFLVTVSDNRPTLDPIPDQTMPHGQGSLTVALKAHDADNNDTVSFPPNRLTVSGYSPTYDLQQQLGLYVYTSGGVPNYFQSAQWGNGKWVFSAVDGNRYLIMPSGQVLQYVADATSPAGLTPFAALDPSVWVNPLLLFNAQAPQAPTGISLLVTGNTLKVTAPTDYSGTFRVTVTASDGALTTAQSFLVHVTDDRPVLAAIADQTVAPSTTPTTFTVPISVSDTNGDTPSLQASVIGSSPEYDLQQQLGLYEYQGPTGPSYFQSSAWGNGKWLFSAITGNRYLLMPNGQVLSYVADATSPAGLPVIAQLVPADWTDPQLLTNAKTTQSNQSPSANVSGTILTVEVPANYNGTFRVKVTASDGVTVPPSDGSLSSTQSFLVNVTAGSTDDTPVLASLADQTVNHTQTYPTIPLSVTDAEQTPTVLKQVFTARPGPAFDLQQELGLYAYQGASGPNYFQSAQWDNGKWLFSALNGGRYLVLPTGEIKLYVADATNVSQLTPVTQLDPSVYLDPRLLTGPAALPIGATVSNTQLALSPAASVVGSFWTTVLATDGVHLTEQRFLSTVTNSAPLVGAVPTSGVLPADLPDITMPMGSNPVTVPLLSSDADGDTVTLQPRVSTPGAATVNIDANGVLTINTEPTFLGTFRVYITATDGLTSTVQSFSVTTTSGGPWLSTIPNEAQTPTQPLTPITINYGSTSSNPVQVNVSVYAYNPGTTLQHELGLYAQQGTSGPNYLVMPTWGNGKWLWSATTGQRYFILPNGEVRQWATGETNVGQTTLVATVDPSYYANPLLLTAPSALPVTTSLDTTTNKLTVTPGTGYFGSFWVDVTVYDGFRSAEQRFLVNATN